MRLADRVVVVVGVGSTIGQACVERFAREGAHVLAVDPNPTSARQACEGLDGTTAPVPYVAPLADQRAAADFANQVNSRWGRVDAFVHCASAMDVWPVETEALERWEEIARVNLLGPVAWTRAILPLLLRADAGSVVYLGSIDGIRGNHRVPAYSATKGGLGALTHVMAQEYGPRGIRVNCVASAGISQLGSDAPPVQRTLSDEALLLRLTPLGRRPQPAEIAAACLFFVSEDSSYVTGAVLPVDGGRIAPTPGVA